MNRILFGAVCAFTLACGDPDHPTAPAGPDLSVTPSPDAKVIVVLKARLAPGGHASNKERAAEVARGLGLAASQTYGSALFGFAATVPATRLEALQKNPHVAFIGPDNVAVADQVLPAGINRLDADASSARSGDGRGGAVSVGIAILDTGIDDTHPDLNVVGGYNCNNGNSYQDGDGHGTHVAGTAAAKDDAIGVVGVAPGASLYAVRVLNDKGSGSTSAVICGIDWVTANAGRLGIRVANMSLGMKGSDDGNCGRTNKDPLHLAICASVAGGVTYVVSAGNEDGDLAAKTPAAYNEVLTATAITDFDGQPGGLGAVPSDCTYANFSDDTPTYFSNFTTAGSPDAAHTIAGPGHCVLSTVAGGGYELLSGTSMAAPHVTGAAALCIASGKCNGAPASVINQLLSDAAARPASYGFTGDPRSPITVVGKRGSTTLNYGYLVYAGRY